MPNVAKSSSSMVFEDISVLKKDVGLYILCCDPLFLFGLCGSFASQSLATPFKKMGYLGISF